MRQTPPERTPPPKLPLNPFRLDSMTYKFIKGYQNGETPLETVIGWTTAEKERLDRELDFIRLTFLELLEMFEKQITGIDKKSPCIACKDRENFNKCFNACWLPPYLRTPAHRIKKNE